MRMMKRKTSQTSTARTMSSRWEWGSRGSHRGSRVDRAAAEGRMACGVRAADGGAEAGVRVARAAAVEARDVRRVEGSMMNGMRVALRCGLLLLLGMLAAVSTSSAEPAGVERVVPGVWFLLGDASKGYSNTTVIEMRDYLIVVDANYPGRAKELIALMPQLSPKPVRYVFDTHAHGDHSYGNSTWTRAGVTTMAFSGVVKEMDRWEPGRWQTFGEKRADVLATGEHDVERPKKVIEGDKLVLRDEGGREVDFLFLGWGHTPGDGYVWLPQERVLATGDAAVNGPRNKLADAWVANWPKVLEKAIALGPLYVLPGHGARGGVEILTGQRQFLLDLYAAVAAHEKSDGKIMIALPETDANWIPKDLTLDVEATASEIRGKAPAGGLPNVWK